MDGNDEVSEDVIESHLSCFDSGSDAGCEGDFSCEGGVDVDVGAPGKTDCARIRQQARRGEVSSGPRRLSRLTRYWGDAPRDIPSNARPVLLR